MISEGVFLSALFSFLFLSLYFRLDFHLNVCLYVSVRSVCRYIDVFMIILLQ